ncbi:hypothetical protein F8M49_22420 [Rhodococcus zopfii]|uniref:Exonuclease domain-containing protein n=1 Tax=Rhodococcus zopfii TaxID=43772 RepID=A0ABU3WVQ6_9NOCA|nr:hypothetical protein [Rhodococcus zopfii]
MTDQLPILFLDTETTGLHTDRRPWEIAWIRREIDGTETERLIQISDVDLATAELKGLQVGRFHERYFRNIGVDQKPDNVEIDREFLAAHAVEEATRGAIIVGAVPNFDTETLAAMLRRHRLCPSWHYQLVDIETLAAGWLRAMPHSAPPSSSSGRKPQWLCSIARCERTSASPSAIPILRPLSPMREQSWTESTVRYQPC